MQLLCVRAGYGVVSAILSIHLGLVGESTLRGRYCVWYSGEPRVLVWNQNSNGCHQRGVDSTSIGIWDVLSHLPFVNLVVARGINVHHQDDDLCFPFG